MLTRLLITMTSRHIGTDDYGHRYYEGRRPKRDGTLRRFVLYSGKAEASKVPPDWHGWLHHVEKNPPPVGGYPRRSWQKDHQPNLSGTIYAHQPKGSGGGTRPKATGDYEPWKPE